MTRKCLSALLLVASTTLGLGACAGSLVHEKPENVALNQSMTDMWASDIRRVARTGDWILTRSYSKTGDAIVGLTLGESFSHAVIYDAERGTIIEAVKPVVREVPLENLLARNRYAIVVRPVGANPERGLASLARARSVIGAEFDYSGMLGLDDEDKFYCSELVAWASEIDHEHLIITPAQLFDEAEVIYLSGARDERQVQLAAEAMQAERRPRVAAQ